MKPLTPYVHRNSPIHRLNPLTKGAFFLCVVIVAFTAPFLWVVLSLLGAVVIVAAAAKVTRNLIALVLKSAFLIVVLIFIVQGLFYPGSKAALWTIGPVTVWREGLRFASFTASRLLAIIAATVLFMLTTRAEDLVSEMMAHGLSRKLGYVVLMSMQIMPQMQARAAAILDAQRSRGLETEGGLMKRFRAYVPIIGPLVVGSIISLETRSLAIEARGFSSSTRRVRVEEIHDSRGEQMARWAAAAAMASFVVWRLVSWISSLIR
ncbi:MAG: energy-coupling factor transporter transmembrane component T [Bacillota bacterium]|nr:energy-coupling factor transporter transmembrane component T [Bacillota bacterium]